MNERQVFEVQENNRIGHIVGKIEAQDKDARDELHFILLEDDGMHKTNLRLLQMCCSLKM